MWYHKMVDFVLAEGGFDMKNPLKICSVAGILLLMFLCLYLTASRISFVRWVSAAEGTSNSSILSDKDWKIELDENTQTGAHEFDFIQKSLSSTDITDNGHFLLITGIILAVLGVTGVAFFSFCLYKLCKNTKKHRKKRSATHYK